MSNIAVLLGSPAIEGGNQPCKSTDDANNDAEPVSERLSTMPLFLSDCILNSTDTFISQISRLSDILVPFDLNVHCGIFKVWHWDQKAICFSSEIPGQNQPFPLIKIVVTAIEAINLTVFESLLRVWRACLIEFFLRPTMLTQINAVLNVILPLPHNRSPPSPSMPPTRPVFLA